MGDGPLFALLPLLAAITFGCWLLSELTGEYSWVDRLWSVLPPVYLVIIAGSLGFADPRIDLMALLTVAWGARLTFNFWRKGGYAAGGEDYRWAVLRERMSPFAFRVFNATFISPYQHALIFLFAVGPAHTAWQHRDTPLGALDVGLAVLFLGLLTFETIADQQQWVFHQQKAARRERGEDGPMFCDTGLWSLSRHPNFFAELSQWWVFYGFAVAASGTWLHPTIAGTVLLTLLFDGSTRFTESITASKYATYADYQARVSRLIPRPPRA